MHSIQQVYDLPGMIFLSFQFLGSLGQTLLKEKSDNLQSLTTKR